MAARFMKLALTGAAALSVAACGSSNTSSPPTSSSAVVAAPTTSPPAPPGGEQRVKGLIASVAGAAAQVTQKNGTATVDFTASTKIREITPAALNDVTAGDCVSVRVRDGQPDIAASVRISPAVDGKCPPGHGPARGTVASVAGNTITVNTANAAQPVTVNEKTKYTKEVATTSQAVTQGKCITARGSQNGGALLAATISLRPAADGTCSDGGGPRRR